MSRLGETMRRLANLEAGHEEQETGVSYAELGRDGMTREVGSPTRCTDDYHSGVQGSDGVVRVMLPGGRTQVMRPCPKCEAG
jgi:hypothetical protein